MDVRLYSEVRNGLRSRKIEGGGLIELELGLGRAASGGDAGGPMREVEMEEDALHGIFNVGESRCYRIEGEDIRQVSVDDTPSPSPVGGATSPVRRGTDTQVIGGFWAHQEIDPHVREIELSVGATYLLCSDGLTDMVRAPDIHNAVGPDLAQGAKKLFDLAMTAGGRDNVSVVQVRAC